MASTTKQSKKKASGDAPERQKGSLLRKLLGETEQRETAQETIPYEQMFSDGICRVKGGYTKTILFNDLNYLLASNEEQSIIFEEYCDFLNYLDSSIFVQICIMISPISEAAANNSIRLPDISDKHGKVRKEFTDFLYEQFTKGNNGLRKMKYITFGIKSDSLKAAKPRLMRVEADLLMNFKKMGVSALPLNGYERLALLHDCFHPDASGRFCFSWEDMPRSGLSTKDYIAPSSFNFEETDCFRVGKVWGAVSFLQINPTEHSEELLHGLIGIGHPITVTINLRSMDQAKAIKEIGRLLSDLGKMRIEEEQKAFRGGYFAALPPELKSSSEDVEVLLRDLQKRNERMFKANVLVMMTAKSQQKLETQMFSARGIAQMYNCDLKRLDYRQEQGLMSCVPIGINEVDIQRSLTTSEAAVFLPFTTQEIFMEGEALYYGLNALSNNMIMANRKLLKNPNGIILGIPGSGKSFAAKQEILIVFLVTRDDIIITDPEAEYFPLVSCLGGQVIKLSATSPHCVNPMDMQPDMLEGENPIALKSDFLLSLFALIMDNELTAQEKSIIDRCIPAVYRDYLNDPRPENMPILEDLYNLILEQAETDEKAKNIAVALEIYVKGSLKQFNQRTNVDIQNRLVCFDIKELGNNLKAIGMLILQDQVWQRVTANRAAKRTTWFYQDEFHLLLREEQTAKYSIEIWKRFRKWGGIPTAITQNVKDFLENPQIENILDNSDFALLLSQAPGDREILEKRLGISHRQLEHVTSAPAGEGLVKSGSSIVPFVNRFPKDTELYRLMTTKPDEVKETSA